MAKSVAAINADLKKLAADVPKVLSDLTKYSSKIKDFQSAYAKSSQVVMKEAADIEAKATKAKADLRRQYEADLKAIEMKEKADHDANRKSLDAVGKQTISALKFDMTVVEAGNIARMCKLGADECNSLGKELKKADGDKDLRKTTEALATKTAKDLDGLAKSYAALAADGNKVLGAFR